MLDLSTISTDELQEHLARNRQDMSDCEYAKLFGIIFRDGMLTDDRLKADREFIAQIESELHGRGRNDTPRVSWWKRLVQALRKAIPKA